MFTAFTWAHDHLPRVVSPSARSDYNVGSSQWEASEDHHWCPPSWDSHSACEGPCTHTHLQSQLCFVVVTKRHPSTTITKETFVTKVVFFYLRLRDVKCFLPDDFCLTSVLSSSFAFLVIAVHRWPNYCRVQWQWRICFWAGFQVNDSALNVTEMLFSTIRFYVPEQFLPLSTEKLTEYCWHSWKWGFSNW